MYYSLKPDTLRHEKLFQQALTIFFPDTEVKEHLQGL